MTSVLTNDRSNYLHLFQLMEKSAGVDEAIRYFADFYKTPHVAYHMLQTMAPEYDAPFVRTTYPDAWVGRYLIRDYVRIDPVAREGFQRLLPFEWAAIEIPSDAGEFMRDAERHGIMPSGYSIPVIDRLGRRALFSINGFADEAAWGLLLSENKTDWHELAHLIHRKAITELFGTTDPTPKLGPRELECLKWAAQGKDSKQISVILNISNHTAKGYLKSAKFKLGCSSIAQAVSRALALQLFKP